MKSTLLVGALGAIISVGTALFQASAQEPPTVVLSAAAHCEGFEQFVGRIEVFKTAPAEPVAALILDEGGNPHPIDGFGITGETLIVIADQEPITLGIELGQPRQDEITDWSTSQCMITEIVTESRVLTDQDVQNFALDPGLLGAAAEIETSITGVAWLP